MDERPSARGASEPAWILAGIGWLAGSLPLARPSAVAGEPAPAPPAPRDLTQMAPRELRRVPGIGEGHAVSIARARWEHRPGAGPLYLDDVHGIGPAIHGRVRAWLDRSGGTSAADASARDASAGDTNGGRAVAAPTPTQADAVPGPLR